MQKYVQYIFVLLIVACIAACGGSENSTTAATAFYDLPSSPPITLPLTAGTKMGGSVQGKELDPLNTVSTFTGVAGSSGFSNYSTINGPPATFNRPTDITTNGNNFYVADYGNSIIRKITPAGVVSTLQCIDAVTKLPTYLNLPSSITTDSTNLYVANYGTNTIKIINIVTNEVTTIGSTDGTAGSVDVRVDAPATIADVTLARFNKPIGITTDGVNLYVTDSGNHTIRRIDIATRAVSTLAGTSGVSGSANGIQGIARFYQPARITTDGVYLYVTDFSNRIIRKIEILTDPVTGTVAGNVTTLAGTAGPLGSDAGLLDGTGALARFNQPNGITTDGTNLYVTDSYQNTIRKIVISTGVVTTISGVAKTANDSTLGIGGAVDSPGVPSFYTPIGVTTDGTSLYVVDAYNNTIRKIQ